MHMCIYIQHYLNTLTHITIILRRVYIILCVIKIICQRRLEDIFSPPNDIRSLLLDMSCFSRVSTASIFIIIF